MALQTVHINLTTAGPVHHIHQFKMVHGGMSWGVVYMCQICGYAERVR